MPPIDEGPFATYTDVTGVVNATAAAEIVVLGTNLKALIPNTFNEGVTSNESPMPHPEFDKMNRGDAVKLVAEIDALLAAIAAAPTS